MFGLRGEPGAHAQKLVMAANEHVHARAMEAMTAKEVIRSLKNVTILDVKFQVTEFVVCFDSFTCCRLNINNRRKNDVGNMSLTVATEISKNSSISSGLAWSTDHYGHNHRGDE